ncbi:hypothetical protein [Microcella alkaliphila]|nr:hypothetical protein [Microcella alkaliphila]
MTGVRGMHVAAAIITVALIAGCAADEPGAAPEPSASIPPSASPSAAPSASPEPDDADGPDEPDATASPTPSRTASPSPSPTATPTALTGIRLQIACDRLLTPQDVYDYNPNIGADPGYRVRAGSGPARAVELSGTACGWLNQTSTQTYSIGVARFDSANLQRVKSAAASAGGTTRGLGMEGYYRTEAGLGVVEAFTGSYWITAESSAFLEPADVAPLLEAIRRNLP